MKKVFICCKNIYLGAYFDKSFKMGNIIPSTGKRNNIMDFSAKGGG